MQGRTIFKNGILALAMAALTIPALAADRATVQRNVQSELRSKDFVTVTVTADDNGIVTLSGTVDKYQQKLNAEKKAKKAGGVKEVDNRIEVAGKTIPDQELENIINKKLAYDRSGYGNVFDNVGATVKNGVVTLKGAVRWNPDKDSALALAANQPGVKDVNDDIEVLPMSAYDDQIRLRVVNAIYGNSVLSKYSMDPAAPIRIVVEGGHVTLYGTVQSEFDRKLAGIVANGVPGTFRVENYLKAARG